MPTVAWINGHAFAGAFMFAMHHDYRIFNPSRGFLCLNELDFGANMKPPMQSIFKLKVPYPAVLRSLIIEAKRFNAQEALEGGLVDGLGGLKEVLELIEQRKLTEKGKSGAYGHLKKELYRDSVDYLDNHEREHNLEREWFEQEDKRKAQGEERVRKWKTENNAKL